MKNLIIAAAMLLLSIGIFPQGKNSMTPSGWNALVDEFFEGYFQFNPTIATAVGYHQYDPLLEDYSQAGRDKRRLWARDWLGRLSKLDVKRLSAEDRQDFELVAGELNSELLEMENICGWEKNPDLYSSGITNSVYVTMARKFAPPGERLRSLTAREKLIPAVFAEARRNLKNPPRIYTEVAIEQLPGIIGFFQKDVPEAFKEAKDARLIVEFRRTNQGVIEALKDYEKFLKADLLQASKGDFRIGADNYRRKLQFNEMLDVPLDRLLQIGYEDLRRNQGEFRQVALLIDPKKSSEKILEDLQQDYAEPDRLMESFRKDLKGIRAYIEKHQIVTIPSPVPPIVQETPPFLRALTFASMDTPGPYERVAKEAFFNVTLPDPSWPEARTRSFMGQFNRYAVTGTAIHEVYPGHYVQFLWLSKARSKVRKLLGCASNAEGWAHYTEQMMLDEGYGNKDPKLRLAQLSDALLRNARFIVGISIHTGKMSFEEAVEFFHKEGYQPRTVAEIETKRGTSDPTYLVYTLGKMELLKLREDYKTKIGRKFSLREFHDTFLSQGFPPIKLVRQTMLGDSGPLL
jgi:uncharacterized protein (DUF885 family)